jgi:hypothetical protein
MGEYKTFNISCRLTVCYITGNAGCFGPCLLMLGTSTALLLKHRIQPFKLNSRIISPKLPTNNPTLSTILRLPHTNHPIQHPPDCPKTNTNPRKTKKEPIFPARSHQKHKKF